MRTAGSKTAGSGQLICNQRLMEKHARDSSRENANRSPGLLKRQARDDRGGLAEPEKKKKSRKEQKHLTRIGLLMDGAIS